ncbi:hypothetical protein F4801DRAFT_598688 [Xylaria longipes]|nr:hypothetical protein F4801DRAFT_598688 [Xylaria longipes]RYC62882.1 hypothetical protein CHU98_g3332 [Xylaria longipes]
MNSHIIRAKNRLPHTFIQQIATPGPLDENSNAHGAVRRYIFWSGLRDPVTGKLQKPIPFLVYQTTRHGPQSGFRLSLVREGFHIASESKVGSDLEDEIDRLETPIPRRRVEMVV